MPQHLFRNGKLYLEYTPQELAAAKLENEIQEMLKKGTFKSYVVSTFESLHSINPSRIKRKHGV